MKKWERRCQVCGNIGNSFTMSEIKPSYRVFYHLKDICTDCGDEIDKHVDYYGVKREKDKQAVKDVLINGIAVQKIYKQMMFAGYY